MTSRDETVIEFDRKKIAVGVLGSLAFVAVGIWLLTVDASQVAGSSNFRLFMNSPAVARGAGLLAIVVFGGLGAWLSLRLFTRKPALVLNAEGILDNASSAAVGFIPWSEVLGYGVMEMSRQQMLVLMVTDPQKYVATGNALKRKLNAANFNMCGSPISISPKTIAVSFDELAATFDRYVAKYVSEART